MKNVILLVAALMVAGCGVDSASQLEVSLSAMPFDAGAGCPASWADARALCTDNVRCDAATTPHCAYPGVGDCFGDGGCATAALTCFESIQGGGARFTCAQ